MEVIVSAAVLVVVVLGVLAGLDSVTRTAANNQGQTVAAALAEKDLERLRAYKTSDLNKLEDIEDEVRRVTVQGTKWRITSRAEWVTDSDGEEISCAITGDKGSYLKISSSVVMDSAPEDAEGLTLSSIVAPQPGKGTLTALVKGSAGQPIVGMPVEAVGPTPGTRSTNEAGCAVFDESEAGSYKLRLNYSGWVDPDGNQLVEKAGTVSAGNLTTVEFIYDRAGSFPVSVVTRRPGDTVDRADRSTGAIAAHTGVSTGYRAMTANSPGVTSFTFTSMFPFSTPYEVYSGNCTGNNPANYISSYFATRPLAVAQVNPGAAAATRVLLEPAIDVTVTHRNSSGVTSNANGAVIYAYPKTDDCPTGRITMGTTGSNGRLPNSNSQQGPGLPFGEYDICAQYNNGSRTLRQVWSGIANTDPAGVTRTANFVYNGTSTTGCGTLTPTTS